VYLQQWTATEVADPTGNWLNWANATYDTLVDTQMHAQSFATVLNATLSLQQVLVDQLPVIALCSHSDPYVYRDNRFQGWFASPGTGMGLSNHWLPRKVRLNDDQPDRNPELGTGGTPRVGVSTVLTCTNPLRDLTPYDDFVLSLIYDTLIGEPDPRDQSVTMHSGLAYHWTVEEVVQGFRFVFTITDQAMWHDGTPVTTADVEFSYTYIADGWFPRYWRTAPYLNACRALDDTSVELVTNGKSYWSLDLLGSWVILPQHIWEPLTDAYHYTNPAPIGCGPFKWNQSSAGDVQLFAWEHYHYRPTQETTTHTTPPWGLLIPVAVGLSLMAGVSATIWYPRRKLRKGQ
jgi:ABC-type transport system substrate-binding protein